MISGGFFQDVSIHANNVLVTGGTWVDAHLNGKYSLSFDFRPLGSSFLAHIIFLYQFFNHQSPVSNELCTLHLRPLLIPVLKLCPRCTLITKNWKIYIEKIKS
jgi:hypothetical protein